jgi:hypothetical protein
MVGFGQKASKRADTASSFGHPAVVAALIATALAALSVPAGAKVAPRAQAARTQSGAATAHLHLVRASGSLLFEEGSASGSVAGHMVAHLNVGTTFTGTFTTYTRYGAIKGRGAATPHGYGRYESFAGSVVVTGGTGRYAHAHGHGGLYGVFDRRTYDVVLQTTGSLTY